MATIHPAPTREELFVQAKKLIDEPWFSTDEERILAVSRLESIPAPAAVETLQTALGMVHMPLAAQRDKPAAPERPRGGALSARAAQALARIDHPEGIRILVSTLSDQSSHPYLRESAVYGLGGCLKSEAFGGLAIGLSDPDPEVRMTTLLSVRETFSRLQGRQISELGAVLEALAALVLSPTCLKDGNKEAHALACRLLKTHLTPTVEKLIIDTLLSSPDGEQCCLAIDTLHSLGTPNTQAAFAESLLIKDQHPAVYQSLGEVLKNSQTPDVRAAAQKILKENLWLAKVIGWILPYTREPFRERRRAAALILGRTA